MQRRICRLVIAILLLAYVGPVHGQIKVVRKPAPEVGPDEEVVYDKWIVSWGLRADPPDKYPMGTAAFDTEAEAVAVAKAHINRTAGNGPLAVTHFLIEGEPSIRKKSDKARQDATKSLADPPIRNPKVNDNTDLLGTWKGTSVQGDSKLGVELVFQGNGTVISRAENGLIGKGSWSRNGDSVTITWSSNGATVNWQLKNNELSGSGKTSRGLPWSISLRKNRTTERLTSLGFKYDDNAPKRIRETAELLARDEKYKAAGKTTKCNLFVEDLGNKLLGYTLPELQGRAGEQFDKLMAKSNEPGSSWVSLEASKDLELAFKLAQQQADEGVLVVVAWKNLKSTETNTGHTAVVVPRKPGDEMPMSSSWQMRVPFIAQAGAPIPARNNESVFSYLPLSFGFGADKKGKLEIFVYRRHPVNHALKMP